MRRLSSAAVAATLIVSMLQGGTPAGAGGGGSSYYLALGTSLAVGFQPGRGETPNGYVDDLWRRIGEQIPSLGLRNVGCPGDTSRKMITGKTSLCDYAAGSQLDAAVAFLEAHPGQVAFITLDVGAQDLVERCLENTGLIGKACAVDLLPRLQSRLARIVDALSTAAGPSVPIVAMTYYNPFLGLWGLVPGGRHLARANQRVWALLNTAFTTAYGDAGVTVADVAATFQIDDFENTVVGARQGPDPRERRPHLQVDVVLLGEVLPRCAPEPDGLPEDRAHVRSRAPGSTAVADPRLQGS